MRVLLDGNFFAEWAGPLVELADFCEVDLERLSYDPQDLADADRQRFKAERSAAVAGITVTTKAGHTFDGDEVSQGRMARTILGLQTAPEGATTPWVLADNTVIRVTVTELSEALTLAGAEQARLWVESGDGV